MSKFITREMILYKMYRLHLPMHLNYKPINPNETSFKLIHLTSVRSFVGNKLESLKKMFVVY